MIKQEKIQILLSSYNGEKYIVEQLNSILNQTYPYIEILIRDDGSTDHTLDILHDYANKHPCLHVFEGENIGLTKSFFSLLEKSDANYIAFSDQDDVWMPEKLETAMNFLQPHNEPALYCSNQILTDASLTPINNVNPPTVTPGFGNAVIESICTGCTIVMNHALAESIKAHLPQHAIWHDWWCYLVASYLGTVIFDKNAYIYYRQHGQNQLGASRNTWVMIKNKWIFLRKTRGMLGMQLENFSKEYHNSFEKDRLVDLLLDSRKNMKSRLKLIFCKQIYRQKRLDQLVVKFLYLINCML